RRSGRGTTSRSADRLTRRPAGMLRAPSPLTGPLETGGLCREEKRMPGGTMRAAVLHGGDALRIEPRPVPEPGPGEVLVEVSHCGVCGSDLHMVMDGWGRPGSIGGPEGAGRAAGV